MSDDTPLVEVVPMALAGERLDRAVALLCDCSRADASRLVAEGAVEIDGEVVTARAMRLAEGQELSIRTGPGSKSSGPTPDPSVELVVVASDDDVLVIDKPVGLVVHPGSGHQDQTMVNGLLALDPAIAAVGQPERPGIVHRLDADTSGLLVVARTARAYASLVDQLSARQVDRRYRALVWGLPEHGRGRVDAPIGRSSRDPTRMAVAAGGREALTDYEVVGRYTVPGAIAALDCRLHTGRTHQIRVHLKAIGHPVVGDRRYGGVREPLADVRLCLHAAALAFTHPGSGEVVRFESALPADFEAVLHRLA